MPATKNPGQQFGNNGALPVGQGQILLNDSIEDY
jgi:hypothetical protein